jgi:hypothetical protein
LHQKDCCCSQHLHAMQIGTHQIACCLLCTTFLASIDTINHIG